MNYINTFDRNELTDILISSIVLIVAMSAGIFGLVYYLTYPEIAKISSHSAETTLNKDQSVPSVSEAVRPSRNVANDSQSWSMLLCTSKPEERKVLEILHSHNGTHLQKLNRDERRPFCAKQESGRRVARAGKGRRCHYN